MTRAHQILLDEARRLFGASTSIRRTIFRNPIWKRSPGTWQVVRETPCGHLQVLGTGRSMRDALDAAELFWNLRRRHDEGDEIR